MKQPYYVIKIMEICMTLDEPESARKIKYFKNSSVTNNTKQFTYGYTVMINFK